MEEIKCKRVEVSNTKSMNDKDLIFDIKYSIKNIYDYCSNKVININNKNIYKELNEYIIELEKIYKKISELIFLNGWSIIEEASLEKKDLTYKEFSEKLKELT